MTAISSSKSMIANALAIVLLDCANCVAVIALVVAFARRWQWAGAVMAIEHANILVVTNELRFLHGRCQRMPGCVAASIAIFWERVWLSADQSQSLPMVGEVVLRSGESHCPNPNWVPLEIPGHLAIAVGTTRRDLHAAAGKIVAQAILGEEEQACLL